MPGHTTSASKHVSGPAYANQLALDPQVGYQLLSGPQWQQRRCALNAQLPPPSVLLCVGYSVLIDSWQVVDARGMLERPGKPKHYKSLPYSGTGTHLQSKGTGIRDAARRKTVPTLFQRRPSAMAVELKRVAFLVNVQLWTLRLTTYRPGHSVHLKIKDVSQSSHCDVMYSTSIHGRPDKTISGFLLS